MNNSGPRSLSVRKISSISYVSFGVCITAKCVNVFLPSFLPFFFPRSKKVISSRVISTASPSAVTATAPLMSSLHLYDARRVFILMPQRKPLCWPSHHRRRPHRHKRLTLYLLECRCVRAKSVDRTLPSSSDFPSYFYAVAITPPLGQRKRHSVHHTSYFGAGGRRRRRWANALECMFDQ